MKDTTYQAVYNLLKSFTQLSLKNYDIEQLKRAYPFHLLFFDDIGLISFKQERSIVTKMGQSLYPELARIIALDNYVDVVREKEIAGNLNTQVFNQINQIITVLRTGGKNKRIPNHIQEMTEILEAKDGLEERYTRIIADLYIGDFPNGPLFAEIKTPVPNLDICAESKSKILTFEALLNHQNARGYLAFAYNPFITRSEYKHNPTKSIMDMDREVLIGEEFWDKIGGSGTFNTLLSIIDIVGAEIKEEKSKK